MLFLGPPGVGTSQLAAALSHTKKPVRALNVQSPHQEKMKSLNQALACSLRDHSLHEPT